MLNFFSFGSGASEPRKKTTPRAWALGCIAAVPLLISACETKTIIRGHIPDPDIVGELEAGKDDRRDVVERLGSPSTLSTFKDRVWYYIGEELEKDGFLDPEIISRTVLVVTFDEEGILTAANEYSLEDAQEIEFVERITPTEGQELTVLQQFLGNLGRLPSPGS
ncbi:outer membrane protein assembly factor BamE [Kiloniella sp. b19]|uniref:outer membrane protein assembly factor BamE n=1 Tax=Kiloniella sp. GXU_MW_B19 TaxID=3141326 RepID=UPI0031DB28F8